MRFETAEKGKELEAKERVTLDFHLNGYRFSNESIVLPELSERGYYRSKDNAGLVL